MSLQTGTVVYVKVKNDNPNPAATRSFCLFGFQSNASIEHLYLWPPVAPPPTAEDWILRNAQLALLRDALVNKLPVVIYFDDPSRKVTNIQLGAIAPGEY